jgi:Astacin (Peptidase family M12A).
MVLLISSCREPANNKESMEGTIAFKNEFENLHVCIEKENPIPSFFKWRDDKYNSSSNRAKKFEFLQEAQKKQNQQSQNQEYEAITLMPFQWGKKVLKVVFLDGSLKQRVRVMETVRKWEEVSNMTFDFGEYRDSDISISFRLGEGSWSYIGNVSKEYYPSMNFGWLEDNSSQEEYDRVVLHEFGHALGMIHEHFHPDSGIPWNREAVYNYYRDRGWKDEQIENNIFSKYDKDMLNYTDFDTRSIMLYAIPNELTHGDYSVGWNTSISSLDSLLINMIYR